MSTTLAAPPVKISLQLTAAVRSALAMLLRLPRPKKNFFQARIARRSSATHITVISSDVQPMTLTVRHTTQALPDADVWIDDAADLRHWLSRSDTSPHLMSFHEDGRLAIQILGKYSQPTVKTTPKMVVSKQGLDALYQPQTLFPDPPPLRLEAKWALENLILPHQPFQSTDETRYVICGTFLKIAADRQLTAVSTNGRVLLKSTWTVHAGCCPDEGEFIMPSETWSSVSRLLPLCSSMAIVPPCKANSNHGTVHLHGQGWNIQLRFRAIGGDYPNYNQVIPRQHNLRYHTQITDLDATRKMIPKLARTDGSTAIALAGTELYLVGPDAAALYPIGTILPTPCPPISDVDPLIYRYQAQYLLACLRHGSDLHLCDASIGYGPLLVTSPSHTTVAMPLTTAQQHNAKRTAN